MNTEPPDVTGELDVDPGAAAEHTSEPVPNRERLVTAATESLAKSIATVPPASSAVLVVRRDGPLPRRRSHQETGAAGLTPDERLLAALAAAAPADLPPVSATGLEIALEAMAHASKLALAADCDCWLAWCGGERRRALPADPEDLVRYLRALEADGKKPATLARRIASLTTAHRLLGLGGEQLPTSAPMVRNALRAQRRRRGAAPGRAFALRWRTWQHQWVHPRRAAGCLPRRPAGHARCSAALVGLRCRAACQRIDRRRGQGCAPAARRQPRSEEA